MPVRRIRLLYTDAGSPDCAPIRISTVSDAETILRPRLALEVVEVFALLCLSTTHEVLGYYEVSRGSLNAAMVHPREVFKAAITANAAAIIVAHNHPSGNHTPSTDDRQLTDRLVRAGELIGIPVLDHIVLGMTRSFSFRESGLLGEPDEGG